MDTIKNMAKVANNFIDDILDSSDDEDEQEVKKKSLERQPPSKLKQAVDVAGEALDVAGDIALDVLTGGIYGLTVGTVDAVDGLEEAETEKRRLGEKVSFGERCDIIADAFTGGVYSIVMGEDEDDKKKEKTKEKQVTNEKQQNEKIVE